MHQPNGIQAAPVKSCDSKRWKERVLPGAFWGLRMCFMLYKWDVNCGGEQFARLMQRESSIVHKHSIWFGTHISSASLHYLLYAIYVGATVVMSDSAEITTTAIMSDNAILRCGDGLRNLRAYTGLMAMQQNNNNTASSWGWHRDGWGGGKCTHIRPHRAYTHWCGRN